MPDKLDTMITFRAPADVAQLIKNAEYVTGQTRTELLLECIRKYLPAVAVAHGDQHRQALERMRAVFLKDHGTPYTVGKTAKK